MSLLILRMQNTHLIIGAGIFGLASAIELRKRGHHVTVLNPGKIPHPLAASSDISKIIRMEYGSDGEYMDMAMASMENWRQWNEMLGEKIYHETGFLLAVSDKMDEIKCPFEHASYQQLTSRGFAPEKLDSDIIRRRFPAFNHKKYVDGFFHKIAGFAESGRTVELLAKYAEKIGVAIFENTGAKKIIIEKNKAIGVITENGKKYKAEKTIVCAGNSTPYLIPELKPYFKITGHPVFHLKPEKEELFTPPNFAVFAADIANSGWYGFPLHPKEKVVKIALHSDGLELDPFKDERVVYEEDINRLQEFLRESIPALADAPIVYTRRCCYTDTLDGHFWISQHPDVEGLIVGSGGSGHGFKMGPVVGKMIADVAEGKNHGWSDRYVWRELKEGTRQEEEARFVKNR